ncbi:MAG: HutD family protein [Bacteroidetes bacterium]|nr:HutD family protein [Bacteroidota bacterium]
MKHSNNLQIVQFTAKNRTTIKWASGTSTEIFIFPNKASFAERNFMFRISTATVEAEESTFTHFAGITRHLMILKGEMELKHETQYTKHLKAFDQDTFSGEWNTSSIGRVTDFNLMLQNGIKGSLTHQFITKGEKLSIQSNSDFSFVFLAKGTATYKADEKIDTNDLLRIPNGMSCLIQSVTDCDWIIIKVFLNANQESVLPNC